ncbi:hypothetical protein [Metarhizobium album]|uniref:hypothetical protein n=1 Tax=Metarhizobium album TaxID=2182425 RepID=UPI001401F42B|nr:hypothetical protein [Rhizobium album]
MKPEQLSLFDWAAKRPTAEVIDIMPAIITKIAAEPWPPKPKSGELVPLKRGAA